PICNGLDGEDGKDGKDGNSWYREFDISPHAYAWASTGTSVTAGPLGLEGVSGVVSSAGFLQQSVVGGGTTLDMGYIALDLDVHFPYGSECWWGGIGLGIDINGVFVGEIMLYQDDL